jgi:amidase
MNTWAELPDAAPRLLAGRSTIAADQGPPLFHLEEATIQEINQAFDASALTSEKLVQRYLNRIEAYDIQGPKLNAVTKLNSNALVTARALDAERRTNSSRGPLHGVPVLVKNHQDTFDMPSIGGATALQHYFPLQDDPVVTRLREAGAVILGVANMDEFGWDAVGSSSSGG